MPAFSKGHKFGHTKMLEKRKSRVAAGIVSGKSRRKLAAERDDAGKSIVF